MTAAMTTAAKVVCALIRRYRGAVALARGASLTAAVDAFEHETTKGRTSLNV